MITDRRLVKSTAAALCALLVLLSPGLGAYEALAADFAAAPAPAGLPGGGSWAPRLAGLTTPSSVSAFQGQVAHGVDVAGLLRDLSGVDLRSAAGRLEAAPVFERLAAAQAAARAPLTRAQLVDVLSSAAAEQRAAAAAVAEKIEKGAGAEQAAEVTRALRAATGHWALLGDETRARVTAQAGAFARRVEAAKGAAAAATVRETIAGWSAKQAEDGGFVAAGGPARALPRLARASAATPAAAKSAVEELGARALKLQPRAPQKRRARDLAAVALTAVPVAASIAAVALGYSPLLMVTAGVVGSILLHEAAHLYVLRRLGDDTAARHGVDGVNPLKLVSPLGTLALPFVSAVASQLLLGVPVVLGWAKPIPVDFNKLKDPKKDSMKVALAGPAMNAAIAAAAFGAAFALLPLHAAALPVFGALLLLGKINVGLALFNLIPLPQLDGGKVLVGLLPQRLYERWTANKRLPQEYQSTFKRLYEGPSTLLNAIGMDGQGRVNLTTRAVTLGVFGLAALAGWAWFGAPVALLMLVCSYDYYCIREKIQNEEATRSVMDLLQRFSSALAQEAENDESIQSVINTEEVEHILKNALEDTIDQVVDSEGFDELSSEQKMERFEAAYMDAAVDALKKKGMSADDPATIRRVLTKLGLGAIAKGWVSKHDVWAKWHSPLRKKKKSLRDQVKEKGKQIGANGGGLGMLAVGLIGTGLLAAHGMAHEAGAFATAGMAMLAGTLQQAPRRRHPSFVEALNDENLRLTDKEKGFLQRLLKEMKLEKKAPVTGRTKELEQLLTAITSPRGVINSMVFVGKAGVGKTAVVELLAQLLAQSDAQDFGTFKLTRMDGRYLVKLNLARLLQQDDPAAALDALLEILGKFNSDDKRTGNKVILFVDEIHQMFDHAKGSQMANLLKEPLRDGELTIVAATTDAEYKKYMQNDEAFRRRMIPVFLDESSVAETIRALQGSKEYYEGLFGVTITPEALKAAAEMSKFDQEVFLPGRAFKYLLLAAAAANYEARRDSVSMRISDKIGDLRYVMGRLAQELATKDRLTENVKENEPTTIELYNLAVKMTQELIALYRERDAIPSQGTPVVGDGLVKEEIARKTGVASGQLTLGSEPIEKYLDMEKILDQRVIGQEEAVAAIAKAVRQNKAGLSDPKRPMGVFYLTGPTGSGKTHLAKELARFLFNDPDAVIRVDMTEYQESHAKSRMIGAPPSYVGYEAGGQLTEAVRKKPYSVILLDEIEKAHPDVFLLLLQIMGEGRLTDGQGRLVDFKNTIILMTSNLGMFAVDVEQYARAFKTLQEQKRAAALAGDQATIDMLDAQMKALAQKLSDETKKRSVEITEQAFKETYPPEFQGRLHAPPIVFNRITPENALKIAELNLRELRGVLGFAGHQIEWTPQVVEHVVNEGFSVALGARPLQNAIDRLITQPISTEILKAALADGGKVRPSRIKVSIEQGQVKIEVLPLEPKAPEKLSPGEGAAREVFASVMQSAAASAAATATLPGIEAVDAWVRAALAAYPEQGAGPDISANGGNVPPADEDSQRVSETFQDARPAESTRVDSASPSALYAPDTALALGGAQTFTAAHYENERKDPKIKAAAAALASAMEGWPPAQRDAVLRTVEDPADPHVGFLKLFVEQAKRMTPADERARPVSVAFEAGETLKLVVTRPGALGEAELKVLRNHFTGPVPPTAAAARDKAEAMNAFMNEDGRRLFFDLYRKLSAIPGARLGWSQNDGGVRYWLELPKPAPRTAPVSVDATASPLTSLATTQADLRRRMRELGFSEEEQAAASTLSAQLADTFKEFVAPPVTLSYVVDSDAATITLAAGSTLGAEERDTLLRVIATDLAPHEGVAEIHATDRTLVLTIPKAPAPPPEQARTDSPPQAVSVPLESPREALEPAQADISRRMRGLGYAHEAGQGPALLSLMHDVADALQGSGALPVTLSYSIDDQAATIRLSAAGAFTEDQLRHIEFQLAMHEAEETAGRLGGSLRLESGAVVLRIPKTAAPTQASAGAGSTEGTASAAPSAEPATRLPKLEAAPAGALDERSLKVIHESARAKQTFATPQEAARAALKLAIRLDVRRVLLAPSTLALARLIDKTGPRADDQGTTPLTVAFTMAPGADPAAVSALLGAQLKFHETPSSRNPRHVLKAVFPSRSEALARLAEVGARPDVERIAVGLDVYRMLTEGTVRPAPLADGGLEGLTRELALRVLDQSDQRSASVRIAAADLLAASSSPADLALARDWIRFDTTLSTRWPELSAAALMLARHGNRGDDEPRLLRAMGYLTFGGHTTDLFKPAKRRLVESLAKLLATDNPRKIAELLSRYEAEKAKRSAPWNERPEEERFSDYRNELVLDALYLSLCKYAGPEAEAALLRDFNNKRVEALFGYYERVDPAHLAELARKWRAGELITGEADKLLMWPAVAELGTAADAKRLYDDAASGFGGRLGLQAKPLAAAAAASLVARTGSWALVAADARRALRERLYDDDNFARMITAVQTAGAAGEEADLGALEALIRDNPEDVNYVHEMTQHDAAVAWASLVHRLGLFGWYMTNAVSASAGQPALPVLQAMLVDPNPILNEAAMEALRLRLTERSPAQAAPSAAAPTEAGSPAAAGTTRRQGFFQEGAPVAPADQAFTPHHPIVYSGPEFVRLNSSMMADANDWARRFEHILQELVGAAFERRLRTYARPDGGTDVVWVLRQVADRVIDQAQLSRVGELAGLLLHMAALTPEERDAQLRHLTGLGYEDPLGLYLLLQRLQADPDLAMGLLRDPSLRSREGRGEVELWLKLALPAPPPAPSRAPTVDPLRPHGLLRTPDTW